MTWLLDGNWHRQDIDYLLAKRALEAGCLFALDSDAHSIGELRFSDYVIAHARIAGVPAERVINCWSDARLEDWMRERRGEGKKGKGPGKGGKRKGMGARTCDGPVEAAGPVDARAHAPRVGHFYRVKDGDISNES
jgi:hypothetical protein